MDDDDPGLETGYGAIYDTLRWSSITVTNRHLHREIYNPGNEAYLTLKYLRLPYSRTIQPLFSQVLSLLICPESRVAPCHLINGVSPRLEGTSWQNSILTIGWWSGYHNSITLICSSSRLSRLLISSAATQLTSVMVTKGIFEIGHSTAQGV